jgi:hypothetical protein
MKLVSAVCILDATPATAAKSILSATQPGIPKLAPLHAPTAELVSIERISPILTVDILMETATDWAVVIH